MKSFFFSLVLLACSTSVFAQDGMLHKINNYQLFLPKDFEIDDFDLENDVQSFSGEDKNLICFVQIFNSPFQAIYSLYNNDKNITYKAKKDNWFVTSGLDYDFVFYNKIFTKDGNNYLLHVAYPAKEKAKYDALLEKMSHSFQYTNTNL